jgi:hypothetical protein
MRVPRIDPTGTNVWLLRIAEVRARPAAGRVGDGASASQGVVAEG